MLLIQGSCELKFTTELWQVLQNEWYLLIFLTPDKGQGSVSIKFVIVRAGKRNKLISTTKGTTFLFSGQICRTCFLTYFHGLNTLSDKQHIQAVLRNVQPQSHGLNGRPTTPWQPVVAGGVHSHTGWTVATGGHKVKIGVNSQQPFTNQSR